MKIYLLIFSMFVCVYGFGQEEEFGDEFGEAVEEDFGGDFDAVPFKLKEDLYHLFPEIDVDFFAKREYGFDDDYLSCDHISELFPSSVLKNNGIKWFYIKLRDNDDIPTISVQKLGNFYKFFLDNEGNITNVEDYYKVKKYKRNAKNQLTSTPNSKRIYYKYGLPITFANERDSMLYNYDEQGRVIEMKKYVFYEKYRDSIRYSVSTYHKYNNSNFFSTMVDNDFDTMYYDNQWRPIRYVSTIWGRPYEKVLTYKNDKIVNFKHIQKTFTDDDRLIITNENSISFAYNEKGLVDIITVKYKDEINYYQVYYYTE